MNVVPFTVEAYGGLAMCEGLLREDGDHVSLEFCVGDNLFGLLKGRVKQVRVPVTDLVSVALTTGWLGNDWLGVRVVLQGNRMDLFRDVPGSSQGRIELKIARKDREAAEAFVDGLHEQNPPEPA